MQGSETQPDRGRRGGGLDDSRDEGSREGAGGPEEPWVALGSAGPTSPSGSLWCGRDGRAGQHSTEWVGALGWSGRLRGGLRRAAGLGLGHGVVSCLGAAPWRWELRGHLSWEVSLGLGRQGLQRGLEPGMHSPCPGHWASSRLGHKRADTDGESERQAPETARWAGAGVFL